MRYRTNPRTLTLTVICGLSFLLMAIPSAFAQSGKDTNFIKDSPVVARFDSLATLKFFSNDDYHRSYCFKQV
jgi:hypothetical protein